MTDNTKFALDAWQAEQPGHVFLSVVLWGEGADYSDPPIDGFGITLTPSERDDLVQRLANPEPISSLVELQAPSF